MDQGRGVGAMWLRHSRLVLFVLICIISAGKMCLAPLYILAQLLPLLVLHSLLLSTPHLRHKAFLEATWALLSVFSWAQA